MMRLGLGQRQQQEQETMRSKDTDSIENGLWVSLICLFIKGGSKSPLSASERNADNFWRQQFYDGNATENQ